MNWKLRLAAIIAMLAPAAAQTLREDPIDKETLLNAVRKGLPTQELVGYVQRRGVDFLLSPANRKAYIAAGAHPNLIAAIESAAREQVCATCPEVKPPAPVECPPVNGHAVEVKTDVPFDFSVKK